MGVSQDQILTITKNGSNAIDFQKEALSKQTAYPLDAGQSKHELLKKKLNLKATGMDGELKNSDDLYKNILKLKKTGMLKDMLTRAGITKKFLDETEGPIVPMNGPKRIIKINKKELIPSKLN